MLNQALFLPLFSLTLAALQAPPSRNDVIELFKSAVSAQKFSGAKVSEVLLTEGEAGKGFFRYGSEFTVSKAGKSYRCEDWSFTVEKKEGHWIIAEVRRGRCND